MSSAEDIAEIVRGLSEAQRRVLLDTMQPLRPGSYAQITGALRRKGLFVRAGRGEFNVFTPIGLQVRAALEKGNRDG